MRSASNEAKKTIEQVFTPDPGRLCASVPFVDKKDTASQIALSKGTLSILPPPNRSQTPDSGLAEHLGLEQKTEEPRCPLVTCPSFITVEPLCDTMNLLASLFHSYWIWEPT